MKYYPLQTEIVEFTSTSNGSDAESTELNVTLDINTSIVLIFTN